MSLERRLRSSAHSVPTFAQFARSALHLLLRLSPAVVHCRFRYGELAKSTAPVARTCIAGACNEASCVCLQTSKTYAPQYLPLSLLHLPLVCHLSMNASADFLRSAWATRVNSLPVVRALKLFSILALTLSPHICFWRCGRL